MVIKRSTYIKYLFLFLSPAIILILIFKVYPLVQNLIYAIVNDDGHLTFRYFNETLHDPAFWNSSWITIKFAFITVSLEMIIGFIFALLLNAKFHGRKVMRTIFLIPWALPTAIMAVGWKFLFQQSYGPIPWLLYWLKFTKSPPYFLTDPKMSFVAIVIADVWKTVPFVALLILAGLQAIPEELYESMDIDGASGWGKLIYLTIPLLIPTFIVTLMFRFLEAFGVFDLIWVLTQGGPGNATMALSPYIYKKIFMWMEIHGGAATATFTALYIIVIILLIQYIRTTLKRRYGTI